MLIFVTFVPLLLVVVWLVAEFRSRTRVRVVSGLAALVFVAVVAFLWGGFANAVNHMEFLEPHDSKANTAFMDAATNTSGTNSLNK
jgi:4-amino-4-deoxy-L-arabinose transferase-like glycosyltransferase